MINDFYEIILACAIIMTFSAVVYTFFAIMTFFLRLRNKSYKDQAAKWKKRYCEVMGKKDEG